MIKSFKDNDEKKLLDYYKGLLSQINRQVIGIDDNSEDEKEIVYALIKSHVEDLLRFKKNTDNNQIQDGINQIILIYKNIVKKHFSNYLNNDLSLLSSGNKLIQIYSYNEQKKTVVFSNEELCEIYRFLAKKVFNAIKKRHSKVRMIWSVKSRHASLDVICSKNDKILFKLLFNDYFTFYNILPIEIDSKYSLNDFCRNYFKPIAISIGHFCKDCIKKTFIFLH